MSKFLLKIQDIDSLIQYLLNQEWRTSFLDVMLPLFSSTVLLLSVAALALGLIAWLCKRETLIFALKVLLFVGIAVGATEGACKLVKDGVGRVRPYQFIAECYYHYDGQWLRNPPDFVQMVERGSSFPSAHVANTTAIILTMLFFLNSRLSVYARSALLAAPLMVGWSRIYLGRHYPSDVLAGIIVGALVIFLLWVFYGYLRYKRVGS